MPISVLLATETNKKQKENDMKISKAQSKLLDKIANHGEVIISFRHDKHLIALELVELGLIKEKRDILNLCMMQWHQHRYLLVDDIVLRDLEDVEWFMSKQLTKTKGKTKWEK